MTSSLTDLGYIQTKEKLTRLEERLAALDQDHPLSPQHRDEAKKSYEEMIGQYRREIKLYEASHSESSAQ